MNKKLEIKSIYPLSPMQEGMLFHSLADKESGAYFEQFIIEVKGEINLKIFEEAFNVLIERYDILRTNFTHKNVKRPRQVVFKKKIANIIYKDMSCVCEDNKEVAINDFIIEDKKKGFNLKNDILIRASILKVDEQSYKIIWSFHHIILDGWCNSIIVKEFLEIYKSLKYDMALNEKIIYPYNNYIKWLEKQDREESLLYWKKYVEDYEQQATLPKHNNIPRSKECKQLEMSFALDEILTKELMNVANANNVTLNTLFQTIWAIILQRYNNVDDVIFGAVVSGRPSEVVGIETMIGLFINTIPVRIKCNKGMIFSKLIKDVQQSAIESEKYSYSSLAEIQSNSQLKQNLIDHVVVFENYPVDKNIANYQDEKDIGFVIDKIDAVEQTNYNFSITVFTGNKLAVNLSYNTLVYETDFIKRIENHFKEIVKQIISNADITVGEIDILSKEEKQKLLFDFNDTYKEFPKDKTIHELFEKMVEKIPDNIAMIFEDDKLTYRKLNEKANEIGRFVKRNGINEEDTIGIMIERGPLMAESILGVWKAGAAYIPIDATYPVERVSEILNDSNSKLLISESRYITSNLEEKYKGRIIKLDLVEKELLEERKDNLELRINTRNLAYVIYTSGSTGKPKGAMVEHIGMVNHMLAKIGDSKMNSSSILVQNGSHCFDVSVWQFFAALICGGTTVIYSNEVVINPQEFVRNIIRDKVTVLEVVPSSLEVMINYLEESKEKFEKLEYLIVTGEEVKAKLVQKWFDICPQIKMINAYGLSELSDDITHYTMDKYPNLSSIPIGKPVQNIKIYIVDEYMNLCPIGVKGEIVVSGIGVGRGYLNNEEKTKQTFREDPFAEEKNVRLYKTGDLGRWLTDGTIEFFGRKDYQVKIRGFRIELGEIESRLMECKDISSTVVIDREDDNGNKYLCAYVVSDEAINVLKVKQELENILPDYMIPSYFMQLEKLPLTSNGKVDRKLLPQPESNGVTETEYEAPRNEIEKKLAEIWSSVLDVEKVGINDDFFELGGHSLNITVLVSQIHKELNVEIPLNQLFKSPTIKELNEYIKKIEKSIYEEIRVVEEREFYETSSAQKRMYLVNQFNLQSTGYNIPKIIVIEGKIDREKIENSFKKLIQRHEILRTSFENMEGNIIQRVNKDILFRVEYIEKSDKDVNEIVKEFVRVFDLSKAPLLRVQLVKLEEEKHLLFLDMHHIISDGVSMQIFTNEFVNIYEEKELEKLRIQYKDYSEWQNKFLKSAEMKIQKEYWMKRFTGKIPVLDMPTDYPRPPVQSFEGDDVYFKLDKELTRDLKKLAKETGSTMYMVLLSATNILLSKYSGQEDVIIGSPIAGRLHADLENVIGMFVNTLAMRNYPEEDKIYEDFLKEVKENALKTYENQEYQFEELVDKLNLPRDINRNPLFDVMFTMQNLENSNIEIKDLKFKPYELEGKACKVDISFEAIEEAEELFINLTYCTELFRKETIEKMGEHYVEILNQIVKNKHIKLQDIILGNRLSVPNIDNVINDEGDFGF